MKKVVCFIAAIVAGVAAFNFTGGSTDGLGNLFASDAKFDRYFRGDPGPRMSPDGRYSIEFPAKPARDVQTIYPQGDAVDIVLYQVEGRRVAFGFGYVDYPDLSEADAAQREEVLKAMARGSAEAVDGELQTWVQRPFLDRDSLEFTMQRGKTHVRGVMFVDGIRAYILVTFDHRDPPRAFERFAYSMKPEPATG